jgi:hypothetical protein
MLESILGRHYYARNLASSKPPGDNIFDFLLVSEVEPGLNFRVASIFDKHNIVINRIAGGFDRVADKFVYTCSVISL